MSSSSSDSIEACSSGNNKRIRRSNIIYRSRWSDLPQELLEKIIQQHKENDDDDMSHVARVRAVCKSWRSCLPNPNLLLKPPPPSLASFPFPFGQNPEHDVSAPEVVVVALHPLDPNNPDGGILKLKRGKSGKLRAMNPLVHKKRVSNKDTTVSEAVNLLDYRVQLLHRSHYVEDRYSKHRSASIGKVVVLGDRIFAILEHDHGEGNSCLCLLKFGDEKWTNIIEGYFEDIRVYGDNVFAVNDDAFLFVIDPLSLRVTRIVETCPLQYGNYTKYLVESVGDLFLFAMDYRYPYPEIEILKLREEEGRWERVEKLGDESFFLGDSECAFSISAKDFCPGVCKKSNCLYYSDSDRYYRYKVRMHRGLSTKSTRRYSRRDYKHHPLSAFAMNIFWNLKPRSKYELKIAEDAITEERLIAEVDQKAEEQICDSCRRSLRHALPNPVMHEKES